MLPRVARCANRLRHVEHNLRAFTLAKRHAEILHRAEPRARLPSVDDGDLSGGHRRPEHARHRIGFKAGVHQPRRLVKPVRTIQHHADQLHPVPARAEDQTAPRAAGEPRFNARRAGVGFQQPVLVSELAAIRPPRPRDLRRLGGNDPPKRLVAHRRAGNPRQIVGRRHVRVVRQAVRVGKMGAGRAQLRRPRVHHPHKLRHAAADMLRNRHGRVVSAGEHQPIEHLLQRQRFALREVDRRARHAERMSRAGDLAA